MPLVLAGLLLLVAVLVSNFWLALGVIGVGYVCTVPVSGWFFVRARARYERMKAAEAAAPAAP